MKGMTRDCVVEMFDRKIVYLFAAVTLLGVLIALAVPRFDIDIRTGGDLDTGDIGTFLSNPVTSALSGFLSLMVFLAVLGTAGLVPNMLSRGRAEFFLSKPLSRASLLLNKTIGIWLVYGLTVILCGATVYTAVVIKHGFFDWNVLYLFGVTLVTLLIWLAITVTMGVFTNSGAIAIMSAFLFWAAQVILRFHEGIKQMVDAKLIGYVVDGLYYILPKTSQIGDLGDVLAAGRSVESWMPLYSSLLFAAAFFYLGLTIFKQPSATSTSERKKSEDVLSAHSHCALVGSHIKWKRFCPTRSPRVNRMNLSGAAGSDRVMVTESW
jgi:hypothetical protein